jgi:hypothetical protein
MSSPFAKASLQARRHRPCARRGGARSGCSPPTAARGPAPPRRRSRMLAGRSSERTGIFCKFGSVDDKPPGGRAGHASRTGVHAPVHRVDRGLRAPRHRWTSAWPADAIPAPCGSIERHALDRRAPPARRNIGRVLRRSCLCLPALVSFSSSNRMSPSCLGDADGEGAAPRVRESHPPARSFRAANSSADAGELARGPPGCRWPSIARSTTDHAAVDLLVQRQRAVLAQARLQVAATGAG